MAPRQGTMSSHNISSMHYEVQSSHGDVKQSLSKGVSDIQVINLSASIPESITESSKNDSIATVTRRINDGGENSEPEFSEGRVINLTRDDI